jgi:poly(A) polymerase
MLFAAMGNTDQRINSGQPVTPAFLLAAILWPAVEQGLELALARGEAPIPAMQSVGQDVILRAIERIAIPKRFTTMMREIWDLQMRMDRRRHRKPLEFAQQKRFRAAYDFLSLRAQAGQDVGAVVDWWTQFQVEHPELESHRQQQHQDEPRKRRRPRPRRRPKP